jgi:hypothetical protein
MSNVKNVIIAGAVLFASVSVGYAHTADQIRKRALVECLQNAQSEAKAAWAAACPGGHMFPCKTLPRGIVNDIRADRMDAESQCYSLNSAGVFTPDEDALAAAKNAPLKSEGPPADDKEPRRKFWISPQ